MTTTILRDSIVGDAWIQQSLQAVPIQRVLDAATGEPTGDILTGPVRLSFCDLFQLPKAKPGAENPKYGTTILFSPLHDLQILHDEYYAICAAKFADKYDAASQQYYGVRSPFRDQGEKLKFGGYTPGSIFMSCSSQFKPPVVDARGNPIIDPSKVYPGVWAICAINAYGYDAPQNKGVAFGLQSVMLIGDDTMLAGGPPDPNATFGGIKGAIIAPAVPQSAVGGMPTAGATPPGAPPAVGYAAPPPAVGYAAPPAAVYTPPVMPGAPADDDMDFMK